MVAVIIPIARLSDMIKSLLIIGTYLTLCSFISPDEKAAQDLAQRIIPQHSKNIRFTQTQSINNQDFFAIASKDNIIEIEGNNANSMSMGLNYYLKYYCNVTVTWYKYDKIVLPKKLPNVNKKETIEAKVKDRFFLNYCTFGYSMNWWKWSEWEHFIDWMALNGVNMALATSGQEYLWKQVWSEIGLTEQEITDYFTGPSYLPWHRMANIDAWHSPLPNTWIEKQYDLQKQIIKREKELNIRPILTSFSGHVPKSLKRIYPKAKITKLNAWTGFEEQYNSYYLDAEEPIFKEIQKKFLIKQKEIYGNSNIYGIDPFNELDPPSWEPDYLAKAAKNIYKSVEEINPDAIWLQMTWLFYHKKKNWTSERIKAYLTAVPKDRLLLLDYYADHTEIWKQTDSFYGQPYIWCYLGNFGGNTMLAGNIKDISAKIQNTFTNGGNNFQGIGCTLEGLDVNPSIYEFVLEKAWDIKLSDTKWFEKLANRHLGNENISFQNAWHILYDKIYLEASTNRGTMLNARPSIDGKSKWNSTKIEYKNTDLLKVWEEMLKAPQSNHSSYEFDLVNISRQTLENYFGKLVFEYLNAVKNKDLPTAEALSKQMVSLLSDIDKLVSSNSYFLMGKWIKDAKSWGTNKAEKEYYERDARNILTTWGGKGYSLNDYANRSWAGLIDSYYKKRWEIFFNNIHSSLKQQQTPDKDAIHQKLIDFEWQWVNDSNKFADTPKGDVKKISNKMFNKYHNSIKGNN